MTGDGKLWLYAKKEQVLGNYSNKKREILESSTSSEPYQARWYNRKGNKEDPWISLIDHHPAIVQGMIVYGESNYGGVHATRVLPIHNGANVFIR